MEVIEIDSKESEVLASPISLSPTNLQSFLVAKCHQIQSGI